MTTIVAQCPKPPPSPPPPSPPPVPPSPPPYPPPITYGPGTFLNHNANACEIECTSGRRLEDATDPLALPASAVDEQAKLKEMVSAFLTAHQAQLAAGDQLENLSTSFAANLAEWMDGGEPDFGQPALA